jgi:hypothetical protein
VDRPSVPHVTNALPCNTSIGDKLRTISYPNVFWLQIFAMPVFDMIETVLVKKLHFPPGLALRLIARSTYVGNVAF